MKINTNNLSYNNYYDEDQTISVSKNDWNLKKEKFQRKFGINLDGYLMARDYWQNEGICDQDGIMQIPLPSSCFAVPEGSSSPIKVSNSPKSSSGNAVQKPEFSLHVETDNTTGKSKSVFETTNSTVGKVFAGITLVGGFVSLIAAIRDLFSGPKS